MPDHKFPLQMECLALAVESTKGLQNAGGQIATPLTVDILQRASAFLGWAQSTIPTKEPREGLRRKPFGPLGDPTESPAR